MPEINLLHCPTHHRSWQGDGTDAVQSCPWCEIERVKTLLREAVSRPVLGWQDWMARARKECGDHD